MSWIGAYMRGLLIVAFFVVATVVFPNVVARSGWVAGASSVVGDVAVLTVWGGALVVGLWGLRRLQGRGLI